MSGLTMNTLMREVGEALRLDSESNEKEAYKKYVGCIYAIASNLVLALQAQDGDVIVSDPLAKQVKLAQQCIERLADLMTSLTSAGPKPIRQENEPRQDQNQQITQSQVTAITCKTTNGDRPTPAGSSSGVPPGFQPPQNRSRSTSSESTMKAKPSKFGDPVPSLPPENNPYAVVARKPRALTPMEIASKQNQSLMAAYKARMLRLNRSDFNSFNFSLTIQRKMAENIAIAKAQEEELAKKMEARNLRLEQEAAKRFASPSGMSEDEKEQRAVYKKILEYENEAQFLQQWRVKLQQKPDDPVLICQLVQEVLRCSDHPITELLKQYQFKIYQRLFPLVERRQQELARVKVPLADHLWPSLEDVIDIVGVPDAQVEYEDSKRRNSSSSHSNSIGVSDIGEDSSALSTKDQCKTLTKEGQIDTLTNCDTDSKTGSRSKIGGNSDACDKKGNGSSGTGNALDNIKDTDSESNGLANEDDITEDKNTTAELKTATGSKKPGDEIKEKMAVTSSTANNKQEESISNERKQAQLLMKQISHRYLVEGDAALWEEDDLDYLFDDDAENEAMYTSLDLDDSQSSNISKRLVSESATQDQDIRSSSHAKDLDGSKCNSIEEKDSQNLSRSVSHDFRKRSTTNHGDEGSPFQSLPAQTLSERELNAAEDKRISKLSMEACSRHLESICEDIHKYLDKLLVLMTVAYEPLDTPVGRDQCAVSLEEPFFKPIWKTLLQLFRVVNLQQEHVMAAVMTQHASATPGDLSVSKKLWLTEAVGEPSSLAAGEGHGSRPYQKVIDEVKRVADHYTMLNKLECIVKVCRLICDCVEEHYNTLETGGGKKAPSVGADDLVPILCYVIIHSAMPQLVSECHAISEFIHEGYLMGEEGYCLTTLRTALHYVTSLYSKT